MKPYFLSILTGFLIIFVYPFTTVEAATWDSVNTNDNEQSVEIDYRFSGVLVDSYEAALIAVCSVKNLIGLESPESELCSQAQNYDDTTVSYTFSQKYNNILVYGTSVTVVADKKNGEVHSLHSSVIPDETLRTLNLTPSLSKKDLKILFPSVINCKLCIYGIKNYKNSPILAYLITTDNETIIVDADAGKAVMRFSNVHDLNPQQSPEKVKMGILLLFLFGIVSLSFIFYFHKKVK